MRLHAWKISRRLWAIADDDDSDPRWRNVFIMLFIVVPFSSPMLIRDELVRHGVSRAGANFVGVVLLVLIFAGALAIPIIGGYFVLLALGAIALLLSRVQ